MDGADRTRLAHRRGIDLGGAHDVDRRRQSRGLGVRAPRDPRSAGRAKALPTRLCRAVARREERVAAGHGRRRRRWRRRGLAEERAREAEERLELGAKVADGHQRHVLGAVPAAVNKACRPPTRPLRPPPRPFVRSCATGAGARTDGGMPAAVEAPKRVGRGRVDDCELADGMALQMPRAAEQSAKQRRLRALPRAKPLPPLLGDDSTLRLHVRRVEAALGCIGPGPHLRRTRPTSAQDPTHRGCAARSATRVRCNLASRHHVMLQAVRTARGMRSR